MNTISLYSILLALIVDSFDVLVILLVAGGLVFYPRILSIRRFLPLYISAVLALGFLLIIQINHLTRNFLAFSLLLTLGIVLVVIGIVSEIKKRKQTMESNGFIDLGVHLFTLIALLILAGQWLNVSLSDQPIPWPFLNTALFTTLFFYAIHRLEPHRFLPVKTLKNVGTLFLLLAVGMFVLRASMWIYAGFNAAYHQGSGSFYVKGRPFALQYAHAWRFNRLAEVIQTHWYYPVPVNEKPSLPTNTEKLPLLIDGLRESETFRRHLITSTDTGLAPIKYILDAILQFQQQSQKPLENRPDLSRFKLDRDHLEAKVWGDSRISADSKAFKSFTGKWYGKWDQMKVDHDWSPVKRLNPPYFIDGKLPMLVHTVQYAWIGDGFGWNVVVKPIDIQNAIVVLGSVYHVEEGNETNIRFHRPHVGIELDKHRLIWITRGEIFLEEVQPHSKPEQDRYVITGFFYEITDGILKNKGNAFQAIYTRDPEQRPEWFQYETDLYVE